MKIVCISDTHRLHRKFEIPEGDILLHAGDFSGYGREDEILDFNNWLGELPHPYKVVVAGNHDFLFEKNPPKAQSLLTNAVYLEDSGISIEGIKIWGSPISPWFFDWAFNRYRGEDIRKHWAKIPAKTDILITHGPPLGILDMTIRGEVVGCSDLMEYVEKIQPKVHLFGHIHESYGVLQKGKTWFLNASLVDVHYKPVHLPIVFEYKKDTIEIVQILS